jgi:HSP20 family molecular chaperone IbpA/signal recognition particle receptor subunit beta
MMTSGFALAGLTAVCGGKLLWNKYQKIPTSTPYDVVIRINSLATLATSGWEIVLGENTTNVDAKTPTPDANHGVVVAVLGSYNRGKTFLLNQLCDIKLPSGNLIHTEGISITVGRNQAKNIIFIDTTGTDTAIPKDQLDDKKAAETLLREIALHLCSHIIIVVNRLRATDQSYIQQVLTHSKSLKYNRNIIIVHNLMDVETQKDVKEIIEIEVEQLFEAKLDTIQLQINQNATNVNFFCSINSGIKLCHFILAKHGFDAAKMWNRQSIDGIVHILQTATDCRRDLDVVNETITFVNTKLTHLFSNQQNQDTNSDETNKQKIQVQLHVNKPFIVLSDRKEMEDLKQDPHELTLLPRPLYDDAGYFLGINSMNNGEWQPLYNLYETDDELNFIFELAGFKKGEAQIQVVEGAIIIEGRRTDFKESLKSPVIHQEKIPMGKFKLEVPLQCKIDHETIKLECDEGFYKITCPKKKVTAKILE